MLNQSALESARRKKLERDHLDRLETQSVKDDDIQEKLDLVIKLSLEQILKDLRDNKISPSKTLQNAARYAAVHLQRRKMANDLIEKMNEVFPEPDVAPPPDSEDATETVSREAEKALVHLVTNKHLYVVNE